MSNLFSNLFLSSLFKTTDNYKLLKVAGFIANRIAFSKSKTRDGQKPFSRFIIRLSVVATVISVAVMVITLSLVNGFQQTISQKVFSFLGHIRIQEKEQAKAIISEETPISKKDTLAAEIRAMPGVKSISPFSNKYAMLKTKEDMEGALLKGIDKHYDTSHIQPFIKAGRFIQFNDSGYSKEIMLSANTATKLNLKVNDKVLVYFLKPGDSLRSKVNKLTIAGIFKTGITEYDDLFAICDLKLVQWSKKELSTDNFENEIGGYEVFLNDYKSIDKKEDEIYNLNDFPDTWDAVSVKNISPNIFDWLNLMNKNRDLLIVLMLIVAIINMITCLIIFVLERTKMTGVLKALGAKDWMVQKIFLRHALIITLSGIILGLLLALGLLWLQQATGFIRLPEDAYFINKAAVKIIWWQVGLICAGTFIVCLLILIIPTWLVKKIQPVKAIQFR